jgi:quercetin 2,3-dioxygenase
MIESLSGDMPKAVKIAASADRFGEQRGRGISTIAFKVMPENPGDPLILENSLKAKGGPPRHFHYDQEEWFYILEGEFQFEVGSERFHLEPGDSLLAPRRVPHAWALVGAAQGKILIAFLRSLKMEAYFREVTKANALPPQDSALLRVHGMELVGPPLPVG